ncbi:hypothetical protein RND81_02G173300 [Saponaria officinalis]|uniref:Uncharacterized protein n=1 Tax=Saponaria officinalis TaxID=3572 RepID=A0AAW1MQY9_SAPOF
MLDVITLRSGMSYESPKMPSERVEVEDETDLEHINHKSFCKLPKALKHRLLDRAVLSSSEPQNIRKRQKLLRKVSSIERRRSSNELQMARTSQRVIRLS